MHGLMRGDYNKSTYHNDCINTEGTVVYYHADEQAMSIKYKKKHH